ncbi:MAG: PIG-L deacetylase family protein [Cyclonatronaceae bacterium]
MQSLTFKSSSDQGLQILCLGAHCDDIEIGCGASLLRLFREQEIASVEWVIFASTPERKAEALKSAGRFLKGIPDSRVQIHDFRDGYLPAAWSQVKDIFEKIRKECSPDIIFTHFREDMHQDHRLLSELTWNTFRNHLILEYEIPKYDGDLKHPNFFIPADIKTVTLKKEILLSCFKSQLEKHWFDEALITSLMRIRGVESASPSGYAEAFHVRKMVL